MADKPNFVSLLRCRWKPGLRFRPRYLLRVAGSVARALRYMHAHGICHGDVYAHNVLADAEGNAVLCDYGVHAAAGACDDVPPSIVPHHTGASFF